jgi:hypothetical protein
MKWIEEVLTLQLEQPDVDPRPALVPIIPNFKLGHRRFL